jgi:cytochrome P450
MRLFPVQPVILRWIADKTQSIRDPDTGAAHILPPGTVVNVNCVALHRNPKYWGPDANEFRPQRWDGRVGQDDDGPDAAKRRYATVRSPKHPGAFVPFGEGVRACLGRKFAEVEMAAVVATLFSEYNVEIARVGGESEAEAIERAKGVVAGSSNQMAMAIRRDIRLVWKRRY